MQGRALLCIALLAAGCGRIGFDDVSSDGGGLDGRSLDGGPADGSADAEVDTGPPPRPVYVRTVGGRDTDQMFGVAIDPVGNVVVAGGTFADTDLGGGTLTNNGGRDAFVAKYAPDGRHLWSFLLGGPEEDVAIDVAVDAAGSIYAVGWYGGTVDFGTESRTSIGGDDLYIVSFDSDGNFRWVITGGSVSVNDAAYRCKVGGADDDLYVSGWFGETVTLGLHSIVAVDTQDAFVARITGGGSVIWARSIGGSSLDQGQSVTVDETGRPYLGVHFNETIDLGMDGEIMSVGPRDLALIALNNADGSTRWFRTAGGTGLDTSPVVAALGSQVYFSGQFEESADLFGTPAVSAGEVDAFLTSFDDEGTARWTSVFGAALSDYVSDIELAPDGRAVVTGNYRQSVTAFGVPLTAEGDRDGFVTAVDPDGTSPWLHEVKGPDRIWVSRAAIGHDGTIAVVGHFSVTADFGIESQDSRGAGDGFLMLLRP